MVSFIINNNNNDRKIIAVLSRERYGQKKNRSTRRIEENIKERFRNHRIFNRRLKKRGFQENWY